MADASTVEAKLDGLDPTTRQPLPYRKVDMLAEYAGVGVYFPAELPNTSSSDGDQLTTLAKVLLRRHKGKDLFDMIVELHDAAVKPTS